MVVYVITEPQYEKTIWGQDAISAILSKAHSLRYQVSFVSELSDVLDGQLIVVGSMPNWVHRTVTEAKKLRIRCLCVGCHAGLSLSDTSNILIDYRTASRRCLEYFRSCGKEKTAIFGINPNSYSDPVKAEILPKQNQYQNTTLSACFQKFAKDFERYDSVICTNYIAAVYLIHQCRMCGLALPFLAAFDASMLGQKLSPTITSITLNHRALGAQAVSAYVYLKKQNSDISLTISVPCKIIVGESTNSLPVPGEPLPELPFSEASFLSDPDVREIQTLEMILRSCDEEDLTLIQSLQNKKSYAQLSEELYSSESTLKYRIKRLLKKSGLSETQELLQLFSKYLSQGV